MLPNEYSNDYIGRKGSSAANAAETSRFRLRPSGYAETGRSMKYTCKPVMKSALRAYESAAIAAHEIPPGGGTKAARCAAYSAFTGVKAEFDNC